MTNVFIYSGKGSIKSSSADSCEESDGRAISHDNVARPVQRDFGEMHLSITHAQSCYACALNGRARALDDRA